MTNAEAEQIEREFSLRIPPAWREWLTDPAWCERFADSGVLTEYERLREENRFYRDEAPVRDYWRPEWLAIHADGGGNVYFLDTLEPGAVFDFDHEKTFPGYNPLARSTFPDVAAFIADVEENELGQ